MSFESCPSAAAAATAPLRIHRHKPLGRRLAHDLRTLAPLLLVVAAVVLSAVSIVTVERRVAPPHAGQTRYLTTSSSSTSNVSTAPPGIVPGDPLSP